MALGKQNLMDLTLDDYELFPIPEDSDLAKIDFNG